MVDRDKLDGARQAVAKSINECRTTIHNHLDRSVGHGCAQPREMDWVVVDLNDYPSTSKEVTRRPYDRPVSSSEHILNGEFKVKSEKSQHERLSFRSRQRARRLRLGPRSRLPTEFFSSGSPLSCMV